MLGKEKRFSDDLVIAVRVVIRTELISALIWSINECNAIEWRDTCKEMAVLAPKKQVVGGTCI